MQTETGKWVRWLDDKGYGFIKPDSGGNDLFLPISALRGMSRPPVVGDTLHYQTEFDASGKRRAIQARIEGVPPALTLEPVARNRARPTGSARSDRRSPNPRPRRNRPQKGRNPLPWLAALLIIGGVSAYNKWTPSPAAIVDSPTPLPEVESVRHEQTFQCQAGKVYCSQMRSREEAEFYLDHCPGMKMDGDGDGIPCESQF
jgi:cold shock CspA family protein